MAKEAVPPLKGLTAREVVLSRKVTRPGAVAVLGKATMTVAVNTRLCPMTAGFAGELTAVLVTAGWTTWEMAMAVLGLKLASPL